MQEAVHKTILVVEDERSLSEAIQAKLRKSGFDVLTARSVDEAFVKIQTPGSVDAIWLDHYLLGAQNGLDFVHKCKREDSWCNQLPIFVISNTATHDKVQNYLQAGIYKYYVKAEKRLDEIIAEIKEALHMHL